ncbi:MAG: ClpXP protease specificity-enhancing factor [Gammaproteobacteria bacterium]|nr:ClpXP protease specificity-enhancing factor [Gammaproteobacteria bacterium]
MTSSKPYLLRALYEWILDNESTPYILVDASHEGLSIPPGIASDGKVVLNLAPQAIQDLQMSNEFVGFSARFGGVPHDVYCPMASLLAIYARETGEGMMFPAEDATEAEDAPADETKSSGPTLKIIK